MSPANDPVLATDGTQMQSLLARRRSVRRYRTEPVPRELLLQLIDAATLAPSNFNRQPWHFVVLDQAEWIAALNALLRRGLAAVERQDTAGEMFSVLDHVRAWLYPLEGSAALIFACYKPVNEKLDESICAALHTGDSSRYNPNLLSLGMAIQNLLLTAGTLGLGACMHSGPLPFLRGPINGLLNLPARMEVAGLVSVGWPDETPAAPPRRVAARVSEFRDGPVPPAWEDVWT